MLDKLTQRMHDEIHPLNVAFDDLRTLLIEHLSHRSTDQDRMKAGLEGILDRTSEGWDAVRNQLQQQQDQLRNQLQQQNQEAMLEVVTKRVQYEVLDRRKQVAAMNRDGMDHVIPQAVQRGAEQAPSVWAQAVPPPASHQHLHPGPSHQPTTTNEDQLQHQA